MILGVHGRKRSGPGETFWQYRPYAFGDSTQRIDWHKSARSDRIYIRENEWEAANTLWLWAVALAVACASSRILSKTTKRDRAQLIALAMACLAIRAHERVAALGSPFVPGHSRTALVRMAQLDARPRRRSEACPDQVRLPRFSTVLMLGDFLEKPEAIAASASAARRRWRRRPHGAGLSIRPKKRLPYAGRIEFRGMAGPRVIPGRQDGKLARGLSAEIPGAARGGARHRPPPRLDVHRASHRRSRP